VVIGILIVLSINNWNQDRIDRKLEKKILIDVREELMTSKSKIVGAINRREVIYKPAKRYMKLMDEGNISYKDFSEIHKKNFFSGEISSGDVNLISNDSLKYLITDWKDTAALFLQVENSSFQGHRRFSEYFDKRFPNLGNQFHNKTSEDL
jgi:hypothetical protein